MCNCHGLTRIPPNDGLPISEHHPVCEDYTLETYYRFKTDGSSLIDTKENVDFVAGGYEAVHGTDYTIDKVTMTKDQFENLNEFAGF